MLPFVFEPGMGFERYVDYVLDVPMYFVYRDGRYIDASGQSFRDFMAGRLPALPGELPTLSDWGDHLTTAFPEVRLKRYPGDARRRRRLLALALRAAGLVDRAALRRYGAGRRGRAGARLDRGGPCLAARRGAPDRPGARRSARHRGRRRPRGGGDRQGGARGARPDRLGRPGRDPLSRPAWSRSPPRAGRPAEEKLERFHEAWGGRVDPVFAEYAF